MKRFLIVASVLMAFVGATSVYSLVRADDIIPMTEAHILRIRSNCVEAQATLSQLHASDALLRVNRGQLYESISTKLMAPFNSRIALSRLDGANLFMIATSYESQLETFRTSYQQYEEAMSGALKINCVNEPVAFYDAITDARNKRSKAHDSTLALNATIGAYKSEFESFAKKFEEK